MRRLEYSKPAPRSVAPSHAETPGSPPGKEPAPTDGHRSGHRLPTHALPTNALHRELPGKGGTGHAKPVPRLPEHRPHSHRGAGPLPTHDAPDGVTASLPVPAPPGPVAVPGLPDARPSPPSVFRIGLPDAAPAPVARTGPALPVQQAPQRPVAPHSVPMSAEIEPFEPRRVTTYFDL